TSACQSASGSGLPCVPPNRNAASAGRSGIRLDERCVSVIMSGTSLPARCAPTEAATHEERRISAMIVDVIPDVVQHHGRSIPLERHEGTDQHRKHDVTFEEALTAFGDPLARI